MPLRDQLLAIIARHPELISESQRGRVAVDCRWTKARGRTTFHPSADGPVELIPTIDLCGACLELLNLVRNMRTMSGLSLKPFETTRMQYLLQDRLSRSPLHFTRVVEDGGSGRTVGPLEISTVDEFVIHVA